MVSLSQKGDFSKTKNLLEKLKDGLNTSFLDRYGQMGVEALSSATPKDTGKTADSWGYKIEKNASSVKLIWTNSNINEGVNIAIILQYGHGTGTGGFVQGIDYINPAMRPVFQEILDQVSKEVIK